MLGQGRFSGAILLALFVFSHSASSATIGFKPAVNYPVGTNPVAVAAGDFNGDGTVDLAIANNGNPGAGDDGSVSILLGNGDGTFQRSKNIAAGKNPISIAVGDFNRDGKADLVLIDSSGLGVLLGNGDGTFGPVTYFPTASGPTSLATADLDGDNILDLAVATHSSLSVLLGKGDGTFQTHVDYSVSGTSVIAADMSGDGKTDLIAAGPRFGFGLVAVLLGNGDGTFQNGILSQSGLNDGRQVVFADFNLDGKPDVAVSFVNALTKSSGIFVMAGNGDGTFQQPSATLPSFGVISVADFNGDGQADLVTVSGGAANLFPGNGDGKFQSVASFTVGTGPWGVAAADFNHDKAPDLVVTNSADNTVSILLNTGIDFSISASAPTPGTVTRGQSSTSIVKLNLLNAFDNPVSLTCSVQPAQAGSPTCSLNPSSVTFDASGKGSTQLTITAGTAAASLIQPSAWQNSQLWQLVWLSIAGFVFVGAGFRRNNSTRRRLLAFLVGCFLFAGLIFQAACGGSGSGPKSQTYTITVTGTAGAAQRSTAVTLTVQ